MRKRSLFSVVSVILSACILIACGGGGAKTDDGTHGPGEAVQVGDLVITMNRGQISTYKVLVEFTIENKGSSEVVLDPETSFVIEGDNDGTAVVLKLDPVSCSNSLSGAVPAGGTLTGELCWRCNPSDTWPMKALIAYGVAPSTADATVWKITVEE